MKKWLLALILAAVVIGCALIGCAEPAADGDAWVQVEKDSAIREAPAPDAPVVKAVPKGSELEYLGKSPDTEWVNVYCDDARGWISAGDVTIKWSTFY